jgi:release factor glutamine methyltransferase
MHAPEPNPPVPPPQGQAPGTQADWLAWAIKSLRRDSDSAKADAEILLSELLGCNRAGLLLRAGEALCADTALRYAASIERRRLGEPVAYLCGRREFWSLELSVSPAVLVPRPDTELLVEWSLQLLQGQGVPSIADLGTGSGAIALALAQERPDARVVATDLSTEALDQARYNARSLRLERVSFRHGDWLEALGGERYRLIVSNPPYIAEGDPHLAALRYEPRQALVSGADGLTALRRIAAQAQQHLEPGAPLLLEHGAAQGEAVRALLQAHDYRAVETRRDLGGMERATVGFNL